ncbi:helix-turn-helix transcriptional regulator [Tenacibaculum agarivorans]|uniref:helix-turn-helix transcriptional regulator n=1 Tax=Tenacibaculum agarivorans TaxID=1908389 RepID=UPI00094BA6E7|nr:helix-turn-helix transcriptional regulator [Tenacibaculum agarivorans]
MYIQSVNPDLNISHLVKEYYYFSNHEVSSKFVPIIDDCCYDFIFFKEANTILEYGVNKKQIRISKKIFTIHNLTPPYKIKFENSLTFFTIKLQPWAKNYFFSFIEEPGVIDLEYLDNEFTQFYDGIFTIESIDKKFKLADQLMSKKSIVLNEVSFFIREICEYIYVEKGIVTVEDISEKFQKSRQYINKLFKQNVGYTLKKFITTARILDLVKFKIKQQDISLVTLCYQYNYFDQSHFIKDFKQVCGVAPRAFFNDLPKFLQRH